MNVDLNSIEWRKCPNWPEYEISEYGDVRRVVKRYGFYGLRKPYKTSNGRMLIVMRNNGYSKACHIHRLVLEAFAGPAPTNKHEGAHGDGDCLNNHISNLRWATKKENEADKIKHGTSNRGERFGRSVLTNEQAAELKIALHNGERNIDLAKRFGIPRTTVGSIKSGKSWFWMTLDDALSIINKAEKHQ